MIDIKQELINTLNEIKRRLGAMSLDSETRATLLLAKSNTLMALQKYEQTYMEGL